MTYAIASVIYGTYKVQSYHSNRLITSEDTQFLTNPEFKSWFLKIMEETDYPDGWDNSEFQDTSDEEKLEWIDEEVNTWIQEAGIFQSDYRGNGDPSSWIGEELSNFDECENVNVSSLVLAPNNSQISSTNQKVAELPSILLSKFPPIGVYIIWSSS